MMIYFRYRYFNVFMNLFSFFDVVEFSFFCSYLHYGLLAARAEILKVDEESGNPCLLMGYNGKPYFT